MNVKELKEILKSVPDDAEILLSVNGHSNFTDTQSHGKAVVAHITMGDKNKNVFAFSATNCGFNPTGLNYKNIKMVKLFNR